MDIEKEYVQQVYSRLASFSAANRQNRTQKTVLRWLNVQKFVNQLPPGSIGVDIGCGEAKYHRNDCFFMGCDVCVEILTQLRLPHKIMDLQLADALNLPYKSDSMDAALLVSVLHHFTTLDRRKKALMEITRCLRPRGQVLIYVWAFEQPNGVFPSQDVLVPWHLHDNLSNGRIPLIKFHMNSTKEERMIRDSISIDLTKENAHSATVQTVTPSWHGCISKLFGFVNTSAQQQQQQLPPAIPNKYTPRNRSSTLTIGIRRWSPSFPKRLARLRCSVIEQFSMELAERIIELALLEALSAMHRITFYRFYHVFKKGELEALIAMVPSLRLVQLDYEHANWWAIAEKVDAVS